MAVDMIKLIQKILHVIPFVHFYFKWSYPKDEVGYCGDERQSRYCTICNKKQYRTVNNFTFLDK